MQFSFEIPDKTIGEAVEMVAAKQKVPGWIRRHIKEALKYAHAKCLVEDI